MKSGRPSEEDDKIGAKQYKMENHHVRPNAIYRIVSFIGVIIETIYVLINSVSFI